MKLEDKIELLVSNFKRKFGTNPTFVLLPDGKATERKFLGLLIKHGEKLGIGVGNRILFWNPKDEPNELPLFVQKSKSAADVFSLIEGYGKDKRTPLTDVLNAIVDYERQQRT